MIRAGLSPASRSRRLLFFSLALSALICLIGACAPFLAPADPLKTDFDRALAPPGKEFPLGSDQLGRCLLSRVLYGAKASLSTSFLLVGIVLLSGLVLGVSAGVAGGAVDTAVMRLADIFLAFPNMVLAIALAGVMGAGWWSAILALSVVSWPRYARVSRNLVMSEREKEYVKAAYMSGETRLRVVFRDLVPNILSPLLVMGTLDIGTMIMEIATLCFLGMGAQPPAPEWGNMMGEGRRFMQAAPWMMLAPGIATFVAVAAFNLLGDCARDWLDPAMRSADEA